MTAEYQKHVKAVAAALVAHIPIIELSLIIQDFAAIPAPWRWTWHQCLNCQKKHRRQASNLCMDCDKLCIMPGCGRLCPDKAVFCFGCVLEHPNALSMIGGAQKDRLFYEWYCVEYPSKVYYEDLERKKRMDAIKAAEKKKVDDFLAIEDAKPKDQQIAELRAKLYELYKMLRRTNISINNKPIPEFPFF